MRERPPCACLLARLRCMAFSFSSFQSAVRQMMLFLATQQRQERRECAEERELEGEGRMEGRKQHSSVGRSSPFSFPLPRFCHCHCLRHCRRRRLNSHQHHQRVRCVMHEGEDGPSEDGVGSGGITSPRLMEYVKRERGRSLCPVMTSFLYVDCRCAVSQDARALLVGQEVISFHRTHTCSHR